jgi:hypothetical protein
VATKGTFDSGYKAKITTHLDNGKTFEFNDNGEFKSISFAEVISSCKTIDIKDVPEGKGVPANGKNPGDKNNAEVITLPKEEKKRSLQFRA